MNVLRYNYAKVFSDECLVGLQFMLESISADCQVDYLEFTKIFLDESQKGKSELRLDKKSPFNI